METPVSMPDVPPAETVTRSDLGGLQAREMSLPEGLVEALKAAPPAPPPTDAIVEHWFVEHFHGQPISTDLFNRFRQAAEALKQRLSAAKE